MKKIVAILILCCCPILAISSNSETSLRTANCQKPLLGELAKANALPDPILRETEKSRLNFYLGRCAFLEEETDVSVSFFEQGEKNAEAALGIKADEPIALFWWIANKGTLADISRSVTALRIIKMIEDKLILISEKAPDYGYAGAYRVLGKIYDKAPRFISIGSSSKAEKYLKKAVEKFPDFPGNIIALAEFYNDDDQKDEAKKILQPLIESQQIQKGDYGPFNVEKAEWEQIVKRLTATWRAKSE
ncbi:hypothetical protein EBQ74_00925 [bacterium]|nr:hypothetical protein [bacterium]